MQCIDGVKGLAGVSWVVANATEYIVLCSCRCSSITKIMEYACVSGYAFRHASRYGTETWHNDRGWAPEAQEHTFEVTPSKVIQRSSCLKNTLWLPNLVERSPDQRVLHCWGQRSCRGHLGSTRGQIAQKFPMAAKFEWKNP